MSSFTRFTALVAVAGAGLLAAVQPAAAYTQIPANTCKPYGDSSASGLQSYSTGVSNGTGAAMYVTCPITRVNAPSNSFQVFVDGNAASSTVYCWLYSYDYDNTFLGYAFAAGSGAFRAALNLTPAVVPFFSSQVAVCYLPAGASIYNLQVSSL